MLQAIPSAGIFQAANNATLDAASRAEERWRAQAAARQATDELNGLAGYIRNQFEIMRSHRNTSNAGWSDRLLAAMRAFNGQYAGQQLAEIRKFGGSEVYARITAVKCRGASSLLRDVYLGADRSWGLQPNSDPDIPDNIRAAIGQLLQVEVQGQMQAGQPVDVTQVGAPRCCALSPILRNCRRIGATSITIHNSTHGSTCQMNILVLQDESC
ncbi:hypothetical protein [Methylocella sp.]|uniref:hypothetical protein n=1 Tax=Methylocella sp. TaxID=1978226 RepID=UPI0035B466FC